MARITLKIPEMHCNSCVMRLEAIEDELPGVIRADASYHSGRMVVDYDESLLTKEKILAAVEAKGYPAEAV
jgi:mercuric reductase